MPCAYEAFLAVETHIRRKTILKLGDCFLRTMHDNNVLLIDFLMYSHYTHACCANKACYNSYPMSRPTGCTAAQANKIDDRFTGITSMPLSPFTLFSPNADDPRSLIARSTTLYFPTSHAALQSKHVYPRLVMIKEKFVLIQGPTASHIFLPCQVITGCTPMADLGCPSCHPHYMQIPHHTPYLLILSLSPSLMQCPNTRS